MTRLKTELVQPDVVATPRALGGLLTGLQAGPVLSRGLLDVVTLRLPPGVEQDDPRAVCHARGTPEIGRSPDLRHGRFATLHG